MQSSAAPAWWCHCWLRARANRLATSNSGAQRSRYAPSSSAPCTFRIPRMSDHCRSEISFPSAPDELVQKRIFGACEADSHRTVGTVEAFLPSSRHLSRDHASRFKTKTSALNIVARWMTLKDARRPIASRIMSASM
jgi:hypothetical protein